ncbi:MAG: DUF998 domain-containing protein [Nitrososphaeria archaeon]
MKYTCYLSLLAIVVAWLAIIISITVNPWFDVTEGNLSQLGALEVKYSYIYNFGLTAAGILISIQASYLVNFTKNKIGAFAAGIYFLAAVHLIVVALYPSGSGDLHGFASGEFFLLASLAILFFGITLVMDGFRKHGILSLAYFVIGWGGSILIDFPSNALLEIYNLILITFWIATFTHYCIRSA